MTTTDITRAEVLANRKKWIDFLKEPEREKAIGFLDQGGEHRCCLGHGCFVLGVEREVGDDGTQILYDGFDKFAPESFVRLVGLWSNDGGIDSGDPKCVAGLSFTTLSGLPAAAAHTLTEMNDVTSASPQAIGEFLAGVVEGGPTTPFRPLSDYPEVTL